MKTVFVLQHSYENKDGYDEVKFIGVYSTREKANETIEKLKDVEGYCDYPADCFCIDEYPLDKDHWVDGFFSCDWQYRDCINAIKSRYSCRAFTDKMPSDEQLQIIAESAVAAPSAMNMQPWRVIVVKNKELLAELEAEAVANLDDAARERVMSRGGKVYYNTPCQIIIAVEGNHNKWANIDCGIISQNVALAAESLGINSLICGMVAFSFMGEKGDYFKERLGFPEGCEVGLSVLLGYADESGVKPPHELDMGKVSWVE